MLSNQLSVVPFSFGPQSFPAAGSFPMSQFFHQVPKGWECQHQSFQWLFWSPCSPRDAQESSPTPQFKSINSSALSLLCGSTLTSTHDYWKNQSVNLWTFVGKVLSLLFNTLSRFVIAFLPRSKHLLISWLQSPSAVILEPKKWKSDTASTFSPSICHGVMRLDAMILVFLILSFKPAFSPRTTIYQKIRYLKWNGQIP